MLRVRRLGDNATLDVAITRRSWKRVGRAATALGMSRTQFVLFAVLNTSETVLDGVKAKP